MNAEHACDEGWICEQHPDQAWPHGYVEGDPSDHGCAGPGRPCAFADCEYWRGGMRLPFMDGSPRSWVVTREPVRE